ncbi:hypothetical protein A6A06_17395 [Streptomyces sp. CB02923]|uniref:GerMN domain-containing protein n=1 Tax=Streptomyces sp. CB02923 TaxID=1718985 RepID=UPI00093BAB3E|nr:GerMN domain-containing protein [Streptomyces sp. CB02923]OKI00717.1 hypothetical protein A6A06_17395 [Streptomyces sp. CB02923]
MSVPNSVRARRIALGGLLAGTLVGCGIAPTGVIDAGEPAHGLKAPGKPAPDVQLYFLGPTGLRPASRPATAPVGPEEAINLLLKGPNTAEQQRGLTNVLPLLPGRVTADAQDGTVTVHLPVSAERLDTPSMSQLVCTAANASVPGGRSPADVLVTLVSENAKVGPMVCGGTNAFPFIRPSPSATPPG